MTIRRRVTIAFTIIFSVFLGFGFIAQHVMNRFEHRILANEHIEHVQNEINEIDIAKLQYIMKQNRSYVRDIYVRIDNVAYDLKRLEELTDPKYDNVTLAGIQTLLHLYEEQLQGLVTISDQHEALCDAVDEHWRAAMIAYRALSTSDQEFVRRAFQRMREPMEALQVVGLNSERLDINVAQGLDSVRELKQLAKGIADQITVPSQSRIQGRRMERALAQYIESYEKKEGKYDELIHAGGVLDATTDQVRDQVHVFLQAWHLDMMDENQAVQQVLHISLVLAGIIVFVTTSIARAYMMKKIKDIERAVENIRKGNYRVELDESDSSEFGRIAAGINSMAQSMDASIDRMWSINRSLEETVSARTRAIQKVNRQLEEANAALEEERQWLKTEAGLDSITDLENRRAIFVALSELASVKAVEEDPYVVALIELDHYMEHVVDKGHAFGEQMLLVAAKSIKAGLQESDRAGRLAAEQFVVIFKCCGTKDAEARLNAMLHQFERDSEEALGIRLTFSAGLANGPIHKNGMLLLAAEKNLKKGRNRGGQIIVSHDEI